MAINRVKKTWAWAPVQTSALKGQDTLIFMRDTGMKMLGNSKSCGEGEMRVFITHGFQCLGEMGEHVLRMGAVRPVVGSPVDLMDSGGDI